MNMNEQRYISPFESTAVAAETEEATVDTSPGWAQRAWAEGVRQAEEEVAFEKAALVGFKPAQEWDGLTEAQRREKYNGFNYPSWYPFAVLEGNFKSPYLPEPTRNVKTKVMGVVDEEVEQRKKQFAVPMVSKQSYTAHGPLGALKTTRPLPEKALYATHS
jgi:hypothetical protein